MEKRGGAVTMQLAVTLDTGLSAGTESLAATVPVGFRPVRTVGQAGCTRDGTGVEVKAYANGQVTVRPAGSLGSQPVLLVNMSWYIS